MFYMGLDLGKMRDFAALAVVEREEPGWLSSTPSSSVLRVRYLERRPLGTPYSQVVARVGELTRHPNLNGRCHLVVDSTGVGVPVVESLRTAGLGCTGITAVTITSGARARQAQGFGVGEHWNVPRADLLGGLEMLLERGDLKISRTMREAGTLVRELVSMRRRGPGRGSEHDDLVLALALACWQAMRTKNGMGMMRLPGI